MHWCDRRAARANLAHELMSREDGWKFYGYKADDSDSMTDYYSPPDWRGVAVRESDGAIIVMDVTEGEAAKLSGSPVKKWDQVENGDCEACGGTGLHPSGWTLEAARAEPRRYHQETDAPGTVSLMPDVVSPLSFNDAGKLRCPRCSRGKKFRTEGTVVDTYPVFTAPTGRAIWCVLVGGRNVGQGVGLKPCSDRWSEKGKAAARALVDKWLQLANRASTAKREPATGAASSAGAVEVHLNDEKNGVEVAFSTRPPADVLERLRDAGFRWHRRARLWYARQTPDRLALAAELAAD